MKGLRKYAVIAKVSLKNATQYRAVILVRICFYTLFIYVFMGLWRAIYQEGSVHGYGYAQMVWYLIMTELVGFGCGTNIARTMNDDVRSGAIAYLLGRPTHYIFYQLANSLGQILLSFGCFGALAAVLGHAFVGPLTTFRLEGVLPLLLSISLSILLNYFFCMLIGLSAFVMEDNFALYLIYQKFNFMLGMFLPIEFLPGWLQPVARNLPFSYVCWAPAKIFVDYSPGLFGEIVLRQVLWAAIMAALVLFCYDRCARRLQVNGG